MEIRRINNADEGLVYQCDHLFVKFLDEESTYDVNPLKTKNFKSFLYDIADPKKILLIAEERGNVIAFLFGYIEENNKKVYKVAHISFLYVNDKYRNNGIATKLIDKFLLVVKKYKVEILEVKCFKNNKNASKLYKKYGFEALWMNYIRRL